MNAGENNLQIGICWTRMSLRASAHTGVAIPRLNGTSRWAVHLVLLLLEEGQKNPPLRCRIFQGGGGDPVRFSIRFDVGGRELLFVYWRQSEKARGPLHHPSRPCGGRPCHLPPAGGRQVPSFRCLPFIIPVCTGRFRAKK